MKRVNFPGRYDQRCKEAAARQEMRDLLGDNGQLSMLRDLFPRGARKEKRRLSRP